jgi:hypothetical protein
MDTLVHYKRLLLALKPERKELVDECAKLLEQLKNIDPMRRRRYEEMGKQLSHPMRHTLLYSTFTSNGTVCIMGSHHHPWCSTTS